MALDNQYIKQQIDSVTEFPDGYRPNLETKWEILATSILEQKKQKSTYLFWSKLAVAASLLIILGLGITILIDQDSTYKNTTTQAAKPSTLDKRNFVVASKEVVASKLHQRKIALNNIKKKTIESPITELRETDSIIEVNTPVTSPSISISASERNVEIDYFEPAISIHTSNETIVKAIQFKFTLKLAEYPKNLNVNNYQTHGIKTNLE